MMRTGSQAGVGNGCLQLFIVVALGLFVLFPTGNTWAAARHALLIGVQDYTGTRFKSLKGVYNDIGLVRELLTGRYGFNPNRVRVLLDAEASHTRIEAAFKRLAEQAGPGDTVYIHYSGHGSYTPDLNGDEPGGMDQTWVPFGARPKAVKPVSPDHFDILDDQLNSWLARIHARTPHLIFVSDSCHSGTITRGGVAGSRTLPAATGAHPLAARVFKTAAFSGGVRIGATREDESASEFITKEGDAFGLFTWNWVKALHEASPGDTWMDAFRRTRALMGYRRYRSQNPQMEGADKHRVIFGSDFRPPAKTIPVIKVRHGGEKVVLGAGRLQGMTKGSVFGTASGPGNSGPSARVEITRVRPTTSEAVVTAGTVDKGTMLREISHVFPFDPIPVYITGDFPAGPDRGLISLLRKTLTGLPGYTLCPDQAESDLVLYVIRPAVKNGAYVYAKAGHSLPRSVRDGDPEVWVLNPSETLLHDTLKISFAREREGMEKLKKNLGTYARMREVKSLAASKGLDMDIHISAHIFRPAAGDCPGDSTCLALGPLGQYRSLGRYDLRELARKPHRKGDIITFALKNNTATDYYCYLISISPDGRIDTIFPDDAAAEEAARLKPGQSLDMFDAQVGLELAAPGLETPKFIFTRLPLNIGLLEQEEYVRGARKKPMTPLERFLSGAGRRTRGMPAQTVGSGSFGVVQETLEVTE